MEKERERKRERAARRGAALRKIKRNELIRNVQRTVYTVENTKRLRFNEFALGSELRDKITLISDESRRGAVLHARTYVYRKTKSKRRRTLVSPVGIRS